MHQLRRTLSASGHHQVGVEDRWSGDYRHDHRGQQADRDHQQLGGQEATGQAGSVAPAHRATIR
ncbi:hypothetical protein ACFFX0_25400 [Citricoccus parietis]|uniref:Uncharacterized protein n=1 Tax=Citricoccus parietis TaxID=592307 RepID=A0ABV5G619_9MICC